MSNRSNLWWKQVNFPIAGSPGLGFAAEYWISDPTHYEGWEQLRDRLRLLGSRPKKRDLAYQLASSLLSDVLVAAGGVEQAIFRLRTQIDELLQYVKAQNLQTKGLLPIGISHAAATAAWYTFSDVLSWSRTVVERLDRRPRGRFPNQGLIPAIKPKRLKRQCQTLLTNLNDGPVGKVRLLANFMLHSALLRHPYSGVQIDASGAVVLPVPDVPNNPVSHWNLLTWNLDCNGFALAESIWEAIQTLIDGLIDAFKKATPRRFKQ